MRARNFGAINDRNERIITETLTKSRYEGKSIIAERKQGVCEGRRGGQSSEKGICQSRTQPCPERFGPHAGGVVPRAHPTTSIRIGGIGAIAWFGRPIRTREGLPRTGPELAAPGIGGVAPIVQGVCFETYESRRNSSGGDVGQDGTRRRRRPGGIFREVRR